MDEFEELRKDLVEVISSFDPIGVKRLKQAECKYTVSDESFMDVIIKGGMSRLALSNIIDKQRYGKHYLYWIDGKSNNLVLSFETEKEAETNDNT